MAELTDEEKAAAEAKAEADAKAAADKAAAEAAKEVKFSQADLDKIAGNSRAEGRSAAEKELLASLGVDSLDTAKERIAAQKAAEDAAKTEVERLADEAKAANARAQKAEREAFATRALSKLESGLRDAGLKPERVGTALKLVDLSGIKVEGTEVQGITEAIDAVKAESPEWFGTTSRGAPDVTGGAGGDVDYRTMSSEERQEVLRHEYGVKF